MRVVLIGDIGWQYLYHLGDEAMTEAAVDMLRERGVDDITLVAGQPAVSEAFYGLPCVTRVGFWGKWSRDRNDRHLAQVTQVLESGEFDEGTTYSAIRDADAVIIAGGGNMNSRDYHLLYERLASKRIAEHFGKPLYVTSQTVGPMLTDDDRARVVEIADYALAFGCREETTTALMKAHAARPELVFHTLDDAVMLTVDDAARAAAADITGDEPYVVASFTDHLGTTWPTYERYYEDVATVCGELAEAHGINVLLVPHAGSLATDQHVRDQISNATIAELAGTPRVRATRMVTAREDIALLEGSRLSLSTRYHPVVFATAAAVPLLALASSYYSSVRMRGALSPVGTAEFVLTTSTMHLAPQAAADCLSAPAPLTTHLAAAAQFARDFQGSWWDALVAAAAGRGPVEFSRTLPGPDYAHAADWVLENTAVLPTFNAFAQEVDRSRAIAAELESTRVDLAKTQEWLSRSEATVERYKNRKIIKLIDRKRS